MSFGLPLNVAFIVLWFIAITSDIGGLSSMILINGLLQMTLFLIVACIPFLRTGRMSYVDIAWPFGVALIGVVILFMSEGDLIRKFAAAGIYLFIGLRMGLGAITMAFKTGVIFKTEFPRYQYSRLKLDEAGKKPVEKHMLAEIIAQGFANASVLALPGFLIASNTNSEVSILEIIGIGIWAVAFTVESVADGQKLLFISQNKEGVCKIGLWRYSRHPNYFAEWLVWFGIVVAAIPSWLSFNEIETTVVWIFLGISSILAPVMMYITLVYLTGAKPAEYYSERKREGYKAYQQTTNMFFPWFPKK